MHKLLTHTYKVLIYNFLEQLLVKQVVFLMLCGLKYMSGQAKDLQYLSFLVYKNPDI